MDRKKEDDMLFPALLDGKANLEEFEKSYTEEGLWSKIKSAASKAGCKAIYYVLILFYALKDGHLSRTDRIRICAALGYFILPIDFTPDTLPIIGFTDDMAFLAWTIMSIAKSITPETELMAREKLLSWFPDADTGSMKFW